MVRSSPSVTPRTGVSTDCIRRSYYVDAEAEYCTIYISNFKIIFSYLSFKFNLVYIDIQYRFKFPLNYIYILIIYSFNE